MLYNVLYSVCACMETLKRETVLNGEKSFFIKVIIKQCHGKTSKQEGRSIAFIKECKNRRRKPNKGQTA